MKAKTRLFIGGFLITFIFISALCGLLVVDLSTDRYLPGRFGPMFAVSNVSAEGLDFSLMGDEYRLSVTGARRWLAYLEPYEGLLPLSIQIAHALGEAACAGAQAET